MPMDSSHASSQSTEALLALLALPSTSAAARASNLDALTNSKPTSMANMVMPSKEIATTAPIVSPGIIWWATMAHATNNSCHI
uniref:Secreted protein n=1 Tax=Romanomermis culicivorax TaxID=13658 RepID=A0A915KS81_ROMCU